MAPPWHLAQGGCLLNAVGVGFHLWGWVRGG